MYTCLLLLVVLINIFDLIWFDVDDDLMMVMVRTKFMVLLSCHIHCKSSPAVFDECRTTTSGCQPCRLSCLTLSASPLTFLIFITTQPKSSVRNTCDVSSFSSLCLTLYPVFSHWWYGNFLCSCLDTLTVGLCRFASISHFCYKHPQTPAF